MNLQMGKLQIITPDMVLMLPQCVVLLHGSGNEQTTSMNIWVGSSGMFMSR